MRKEKTKNDMFWQMGTLPFVALWAGSYAAGWWLLWGVLDWIESIRNLTSDEGIFIAITFITIVPALIQVQLVERLLKHRMRGWMLYTLAGTILTFITFTNGTPSDNGFAITLLSLFLPAALLQAVWLWQRVKAAWLWPLATIAASMVFSVPMRSVQDDGVIVMIIAGLLFGIVQGGIMRYLWLQPKDTEKAKIEAAQTSQPLQERVTRLQDTSETTAPWLYSEDQNTQRNTR